MRRGFRSSFLFVLVFFWASHASAIALSMAGVYGQIVQVGDEVTLTVSLDTEGNGGLVLLSTGVLFEEEHLSFNAAASSAASYALYNSGKGATTMMPAIAPAIRFGTTDQVNVDFTCTDLSGGCQTSGGFWNGGAETHNGTAGRIATLVFDVIAEGDGIAWFSLSISAPGNIVQLAGGPTTATLSSESGASFVFINTPEPSTALLLGLGLAGMARGKEAAARKRTAAS